ncbi:MAG: hypothetical protein H0U63_03810, partial [Burkholderiales bacterium]|nr:hypothetical protein [Burkholderiales bacterium]
HYTIAGGLLLVGLMLGFHAGKGQTADSGTVSLIAESHASAPASAPAAPTAYLLYEDCLDSRHCDQGSSDTAPTDYFPANYANQAKFVEPLPAQF